MKNICKFIKNYESLFILGKDEESILIDCRKTNKNCQATLYSYDNLNVSEIKKLLDEKIININYNLHGYEGPEYDLLFEFIENGHTITFSSYKYSDFIIAHKDFLNQFSEIKNYLEDAYVNFIIKNTDEFEYITDEYIENLIKIKTIRDKAVIFS